MREKILEILKEVNPNILEYDGKNMINDGIIESVEIMEIITAIEDNFDIVIEPEYIIPEYFENIDTLIELVKKASEDGDING